jgi:FkbM family methyltransferase
MQFVNVLIRIYRFIFARPFLANWNKLLFRFSLSGLGILNYESRAVSGEEYLISTIRPFLKGKVVLDVGANVGDYSQSLLEQTDRSIVVYAFEPHPVNFAALVANIDFDEFHPINVAVGREKSELTLFDHESRDGSTEASLYRDVIEELHQAPSVEHTVQVISLTDFVAERGIREIGLLKIDTEGNEYAVLEGAKDMLDRGAIKIVQFEFNVMNIVSRTFLRDFKKLLVDYEFFRLLPKALLSIDSFSPLYDEIFAYQNIVAIHKESLDQVLESRRV